MGVEMTKEIEDLKKQINRLTERVDDLEQQKITPAIGFPFPTPGQTWYAKCPVCGPYSANRVCGNAACPLAPRVTC
jgi:hypothetical protein